MATFLVLNTATQLSHDDTQEYMHDGYFKSHIFLSYFLHLTSICYPAIISFCLKTGRLWKYGREYKNLSTMFADVHFFDCHYKRGVLASYYFLFMIAIKIMRHLLSTPCLHNAVDPSSASACLNLSGLAQKCSFFH